MGSSLIDGQLVRLKKIHGLELITIKKNTSTLTQGVKPTFGIYGAKLKKKKKFERAKLKK
jgi:hypothetical protein